MLFRGISVGLALAAAMWAADASRVSTVGVDPQTGKLVRRSSRTVAPRTVAPKPVASVQEREKEVKPAVIEAKAIEVEAPRAEKAAAPTYNVVAGRSFDKLIERIAENYQIHPAFVHAVIKAESNYDPRARSPKGALGMMQLMPKTAVRFGVTNVYNPVENIEGGVRYLRYLLDLYAPLGEKNQARLSLAAYNAGEQAVDRFGGVPPYWETKQYVRRVSELWDRYRKTMPDSGPAPAPKKLEGPRIIRIDDPSGVTRYVTESQ
jgi:soluble lytic murein transglycosylase-like protein